MSPDALLETIKFFDSHRNDGLEWTCKHCIKKSREKKKDCVPSSLPPRPVKSLSPALESEYSLPLPFSIAEPPASDISGMLGLLHNATTLTTRNEESSVEGATFQHREAASRTERQEAENAKNGEPLPYFNDSSTAMIITAPDGTGNIATPKLPSQLDRVPKKYVTCFWWTTKTGCKYSEVDCQFAHRQTGLVSEKPSYKNSVCYYWRTKGVCKFSDEDCKFAHWDTGVQAQAPPPPAARFSTGVGYGKPPNSFNMYFCDTKRTHRQRHRRWSIRQTPRNKRIPAWSCT